jgi:hypothetical protein
MFFSPVRAIVFMMNGEYAIIRAREGAFLWMTSLAGKCLLGDAKSRSGRFPLFVRFHGIPYRYTSFLISFSRRRIRVQFKMDCG